MVQTGGMDDRRIIDESGIEVYISGDAGDRSLRLYIARFHSLFRQTVRYNKHTRAHSGQKNPMAGIVSGSCGCCNTLQNSRVPQPVAKGGYDLCSELRVIVTPFCAA